MSNTIRTALENAPVQRLGEDPLIFIERYKVWYRDQKVPALSTDIILDTALNLLQVDPHQWSSRPCSTCRSISTIMGRSFGCNLYTEQKVGKK